MENATGKAIVVDPQRDVDQYIIEAAEEGLSITSVFETHFHADFLSGHLELASKVGAEIVYGHGAYDRVDFPIRTMKHGEHFSLGRVDIELLETPGHTPESGLKVRIAIRTACARGTRYSLAMSVVPTSCLQLGLRQMILLTSCMTHCITS
jgi:hypothetical protein